MKALVLSGGGSAGPFHLGVMEYLHARGNRYEMYVGVSVGALIAANMSQFPKGKETQGLLDTRKLFFAVQSRNIWKHWSGGIFTSLLPWLNKNSLYNSSPLNRLIKKRFTPKKLRASGKRLVVGAVSLTSGKYRTFNEKSKHIVQAVAASASYPVFFAPIKIRKELYTDGGVKEITPIESAIRHGATEIDVVCCVPPEAGKWKGSGPLAMAGRGVALMLDEIANEDLRRGVRLAMDRGVKVRLWRPSQQIVEDPLEFVPKEAKAIYQAGYTHAKENPEGIL